MYEGTLDGLRVCIKRVRVYTQDGPRKAARVRPRHRRSPRSPVLMKFADLLPGGYNVETLDTPEHRVPAGCHSHPFSARFELDVWWGLVGIHQKQLRCRPTRTCRHPFCSAYLTLTPATSFPMSLMASVTSTPAT